MGSGRWWFIPGSEFFGDFSKDFQHLTNLANHFSELFTDEKKKVELTFSFQITTLGLMSYFTFEILVNGITDKLKVGENTQELEN